ncbi:hypothetical protein FBY39_2281 [Microbacterium sp. SLBN-146]|nr:hypothetical protein FBY39_2281 [Microbacterium sp. SLBN-146]
MGLFQHRPEDPTEWAGLPSEPLDDESAVDRLPDSAAVDPALTALFGGGASTSLVVPLAGDRLPTSPPQPDA